MVSRRLLGDVYGGLERAAPAHPAEAMDEYRELEMLAHAWERGSLGPGAPAGAPGRVEEGKRPLSVGDRNPDDLSETDRRRPKADIGDV